MSQKLIYVENDYDGNYSRFWGNLGEVIQDCELFLARPQDFDLVCFTGGEDVDPEHYGHRNIRSGCSKKRDTEEQQVYDLAFRWKIPMTGICRGSQFLNVMMGGTMVQDLQESHGGSPHECRTADGEIFSVTSSHHQMSILGSGGVLLAWASETLPVEALVYDGDPRANLASYHALLEDDKCMITEAFSYPNANIFAVQHHPEWQEINKEAPQWTLRMIQEYCFGERTTDESMRR